MNILRRLLSSFSGVLLAVIGVLSSLLLMLGWRNSHNKAEKEIYKRQAEQHRRFLERQKDIEEQTQSRRADITREANETGDIELARNPNILRKPRD